MTYYDSFNESFQESLHDSFTAEGSANFSLGESFTTADISDEFTSVRASGLRFGAVQVREYNRTVGDHPGT